MILGEARNVPHRSPAAFFGRVDQDIPKDVSLVISPRLAFGQAVIGAFGTGDQDVSGRVAARIHGTDVGAVVVNFRKVGVVRFDCQFPVVHGKPHFRARFGGPEGRAARATELVGNRDVRSFHNHSIKIKPGVYSLVGAARRRGRADLPGTSRPSLCREVRAGGPGFQRGV